MATKVRKKRKWAGTPAQRAALRKAQLTSARVRRQRAKVSRGKGRRRYGHDPVRRGVGIQGLKKNTVPYARINKASQTVGVNTGSIIPFTGKRIVAGGYVRLESTTRKTAVDRMVNRAIRPGTKPAAVRKWFGENVTIKNPAIRANVGVMQARLGTSRSSGATLIVRRGGHKTVRPKSKAGIAKYDQRMRVLARVKKKRRPQRRRR